MIILFINIDPVVESIKNEITELSEKLGRSPKLVSIAENPDASTLAYLNSQKRIAKKYGVDFHILESSHLERDIITLNSNRSVDGIFLSRPIPDKYDYFKLASSINPHKDVEGVNPINVGLMVYGKECFVPCTADACVRILESVTKLESSRISVFGRSFTVGKPVSIMLMSSGRNSTVTAINKYTKNPEMISKNSEIIVVAVGKKHYIDKKFASKGTVIIDVGINVEGNSIYGDVNPELYDSCLVTPVPGGVGTVTSSLLMRNVFRSALKNK